MQYVSQANLSINYSLNVVFLQNLYVYNSHVNFGYALICIKENQWFLTDYTGYKKIKAGYEELCMGLGLVATHDPGRDRGPGEKTDAPPDMQRQPVYAGKVAGCISTKPIW